MGLPGRDLKVKSLSTWAGLARDFTAVDQATFGVHRLVQLQVYAHAVGIRQLEGPGEIPIEVPKKGGEGTESKPFAKCSEADLEAAIKHAEGRDVITPLPVENQKLLQQYQKGLLGLTTVPIQVSGKLDDYKRFLLTFQDVQDEEVKVFANSLFSLTQPRSTAKKQKHPKRAAGRTKKVSRK